MATGNGTENKASPDKMGFRRLVMVLITASIIGIGSRMLVLGSDTLAGGDSLWRLSISATIDGNARQTVTQIHPPFESDVLRVVQRNITHPGFRIKNWSNEQEERRSILASSSVTGKHILTTEFIVHLAPASNEASAAPKRKPLGTQIREKYLADNNSLQLQQIRSTAIKLSAGISGHESIVKAFFDYLKSFTVVSKQTLIDVPAILEKKHASPRERSLVLVALCRSSGIPARMVTGFILQEELYPEPHIWTEVYFDEYWHSYDVQYGYEKTVPASYLSMRRNGDEIIDVINGELASVEYGLEREYDHPYIRQFEARDYRSILDLRRLPLDSRDELARLLLLPLGVLITALFRHLVGVRSYGVFTPTLLALALVYADTVFTLVMFLVICGLAVAGRSFFPSELDRIPRLAIIFTLVAFLLSLAVSMLDYLEFQQGGKVILLPIIILTSLIDRLYRTIEDKGLNIAMRRLAWTVIIALFCLPVIQFETLGQLMVSYPEVHLTTLALFLLISTYQGKQLVRLPLVRLLAEPVPEKNKNSRGDDTAT